MTRPPRSTRLLGPVVLLGAALAGCAGPPTVDPAAPVEATVEAPSVLPVQAAQVRREVAARLQEARGAGEVDLVEQAAVGPAAALELLRLDVAGPQPPALALDDGPVAVLVAPRADGWPRWFAAVTDPAAGAEETTASVPEDEASGEATGQASDEATGQASGEPSVATAPGDELPVLELYDSADVRSPYRLWARMTLLPGAELPAFPDPREGSVSLADGTAPEPVGPDDETEGDGDAGGDGSGGSDDVAELEAVLAGLADGYASVLTEGDASPAAAEFEPDPFVEGVLARAEAERAAVADVADTTVSHVPFGDDPVLYAVEGAEGDVLAVTALETVTTMTVQPGAGVLQPGAELREVVGIESTDGTLTTRSVAALAFVVPAERGAIRLVAVGEGLVAAEAS